MKILLKRYVILLFILILNIPFTHTIIKANEPTTPENKITIPVILKAKEPAYWQAIINGVNKAANDYGINVQIESPPRTYPPNYIAQLNLFLNALAQNPQAIVLSAFNSKEFTPYLEQAKNANIPVIGLDTDVDSPIVRTAVATDNYGAGELAAHKMAELVNKQGKVAIFNFSPPVRSLLYRYEGFVNTLKENYPAIEVIEIPYTVGTSPDLYEKVKVVLSENPDLKGLFATAENESIASIDAIRNSSKEKQLQLITFDSTKKIKDAVRDGTASGGIVQDPFDMGYKAVVAAARASKGEILPTFIDTGFTWYDASNIDDPKIQALLYE